MSRTPYPRLIDFLFRRPCRDVAHTESVADAALRELVCHAYARVPFYRSRWDEAGVGPREIRARADLRRLPIVEKNALLDSGRGAWDSAAGDGLGVMRTSGTSGRAIEVPRDASEMTQVRRAVLRHLLWMGVRPWWRVLTLGSLWLRDRKGWFVRRFVKTRFVEPLAPLEEQVRELLSFRPGALVGQTGGVYLLARELLRRGQRFGLRKVVTTGATLTGPMRAAIEDAFQTRALDMYGTIETGPIAWQCVRGEYHIDADRVLVEIVDSDGTVVPAGEPGEVVVTHLYGRTMPFIRYRLADVGTITARSCGCGCRFPLMEPVRGRINDFLQTPAGDLVSPHFFFHIFDALPSNPVAEWRVVQESERRLVYEYAPERSATREAIEHGLEAIRRRFGPEAEVVGRRVDRVALTPAGKQRCIQSHLRPPEAGWGVAWAAAERDSVAAKRLAPVEVELKGA